MTVPRWLIIFTFKNRAGVNISFVGRSESIVDLRNIPSKDTDIGHLDNIEEEGREPPTRSTSRKEKKKESPASPPSTKVDLKQISLRALAQQMQLPVAVSLSSDDEGKAD